MSKKLDLAEVLESSTLRDQSARDDKFSQDYQSRHDENIPRLIYTGEKKYCEMKTRKDGDRSVNC